MMADPEFFTHEDVRECVDEGNLKFFDSHVDDLQGAGEQTLRKQVRHYMKKVYAKKLKQTPENPIKLRKAMYSASRNMYWVGKMYWK